MTSLKFRCFWYNKCATVFYVIGNSDIDETEVEKQGYIKRSSLFH